MPRISLCDSLTQLMDGLLPIGSRRRFVYTDAIDAQDLIAVKRAAQDLESLGHLELRISQNYFDVTKLVMPTPVNEEVNDTVQGHIVGLPVAGYVAQTDHNVSRVNANKRAEEKVLQILDSLSAQDDVDKRWLAIGRTAIEQGFMAVNRAIFRPTRIKLD